MYTLQWSRPAQTVWFTGFSDQLGDTRTGSDRWPLSGRNSVGSPFELRTGSGRINVGKDVT